MDDGTSSDTSFDRKSSLSIPLSPNPQRLSSLNMRFAPFTLVSHFLSPLPYTYTPSHPQYSLVPAASRAFLHETDGTLNWLLELGPIAFVVCSLFSATVLDRPGGLRVAMLLGSSMLLLAASLRCIPPLFYSEEARKDNAAELLWCKLRICEEQSVRG